MSDDDVRARSMTLEQAIRTLTEGSEEAARAYRKHVWLSRAIDALVCARKEVGLTQAQLAERLGTTQSAIARVENNVDGSISLRRYLDYAIACGVMPPDPQLIRVQED